MISFWNQATYSVNYSTGEKIVFEWKICNIVVATLETLLIISLSRTDFWNNENLEILQTYSK